MIEEKTIHVGIKGMHCGACSARIERVVGKTDGVHEAAVNLASEQLFLRYNESLVSFDTVASKVKDLGFELVAPVDQSFSTRNIRITGMHCGACSSRIERVIGQMAGVKSAAVNLASETAVVDYLPDSISFREIKEKIEELGFGAEPKTNELLQHEEQERSSLEALKLQRKKVILMFIVMTPLLYISMGEMVGIGLPSLLSPQGQPLLFSVAQLLLTLPIIYLGRSFYRIGIPALIRRVPNMDSLIAIGTGAAFCYSLWNTIEIALDGRRFFLAMDLYYESVAVLLTLVSLGKYLESRSKYTTSDAIRKLMDLSPKFAELLTEEGQRSIPVSEIERGDTLVIKPGAAIPTDGRVIKGKSIIDEALMTGESLPVTKVAGDNVFGGTINRDGSLHIVAERTSEKTMLAEIIKMVQHAQGTKANIARIADRVSYYFVPAVIALAFLTGFSWYFFSDAGFSQSLRFFIAVMVIACPCAMGLATPISIMVGTGRGAQLGILVKNGEVLERLEQVDTILLDKTGTVTEGQPSVVHIDINQEFSRENFLALIGSAEQASEHPLAQAIVDHARNEGISLVQPQNFTPVQGEGAEAIVRGSKVVIGNRDFLENMDIDTQGYGEKTNKRSLLGETVLYAAIDGKCQGLICLSDVVKKDSAMAVKKMVAFGKRVVMVTGDHKTTADIIAKSVGIAEVHAGVHPGKKAEIVEKLQNSGDVVAMVGDGINDAPALARADVGIAMGTGIDIAIDSGDVVLMRDDLGGVVTAMNLSKAVMDNIRQNLFWAFGYNVLGIPVAAGLLVLFGGPSLSPMLAGGAMAMSSVSVVFNALRLRFFAS